MVIAKFIAGLILLIVGAVITAPFREFLYSGRWPAAILALGLGGGAIFVGIGLIIGGI